MSVPKLRSTLYRSARILGDYQAVRTGRVGKRVERRVLGRLFGQILRGLTR